MHILNEPTQYRPLTLWFVSFLFRTIWIPKFPLPGILLLGWFARPVCQHGLRKLISQIQDCGAVP